MWPSSCRTSDERAIASVPAIAQGRPPAACMANAWCPAPANDKMPPRGLCGAGGALAMAEVQAERGPRDDTLALNDALAVFYLSFAFKLTSQRVCVYVALSPSTAKVIAVGGIFRR
jgi:hypothetical protein